MARIALRRNINIGRVVAKIVATLITLWVGGTILTTMGDVMLHTESPFYRGLALIGWTVGGYPFFNTTHYAAQCANTSVGTTTQTGANCITATSGTGVLGVIGLIGIAVIVLEFIEFSL